MVRPLHVVWDGRNTDIVQMGLAAFVTVDRDRNTVFRAVSINKKAGDRCKETSFLFGRGDALRKRHNPAKGRVDVCPARIVDVEFTEPRFIILIRRYAPMIWRKIFVVSGPRRVYIGIAAVPDLPLIVSELL